MRLDKSAVQEHNLILQSYYTVILLNELGSVYTKGSKSFDSLNLPSPVKRAFQEIGILNQGSALMALYALLVVPREIISDEYSDEYEAINTFLRKEGDLHQTTYKNEDANDLSSIDFIRHVRNAIAHAKISFIADVSIIFSDKREARRKGNVINVEEISFSLPLSKIADFLNLLRDVHLKYIQKHNLL
jgi:hypothetical protein